MLQRSVFIKTTPTKITFCKLVILCLFKNLFLLFCRHIVFVSSLSKSRSQLQRLCFPFRQLFFCFFFFNFFFNYFTFLHEFFLIIRYNSMILSIKFLSFLLKNLLTNGFMFLKTIRIKLTPTSFTTLNILRRVVLFNFNTILSVNFFNCFFLIFIRIVSVMIILLLFLLLPWWLLLLLSCWLLLLLLLLPLLWLVIILISFLIFWLLVFWLIFLIFVLIALIVILWRINIFIRMTGRLIAIPTVALRIIV